VLYAILTLVSIGVPMLMSRRWRREGPAAEDAEQVPYGPSPVGAAPAGAAPAGAPPAEAPPAEAPRSGPRAPGGGAS
jgi:hypothetical protein